MQLIDLTALVHIKDTNEHIFGCENSPTTLVIYLSAVFIYGLHSLSVCVCMYVYICVYVLILCVCICLCVYICVYVLILCYIIYVFVVV